VRGWDLRSGSELQLRLERRTYLVSTILGYLFLFHIVSYFLYVFTADDLCQLFVGAMCAAGTLNANAWGYPTLLLKTLNVLAAGVWLLLNHADNRASDYPLIRWKYGLLLALTPLLLAEAALQAAFFLSLKPALITSCCGSLFSGEGASLAGDLAALPLGPARLAFFGCAVATVTSGAWLARTGRGAWLFAALSAASFLVGAAALVSFISIYVYELPTHHCPFCVLQAGYHFVGYPLYVSLLGAAVTGLGVGVLAPFRGIPSLTAVVPATQKRLALASVLLLLVYVALAAWQMVFTEFRP